MKTFASTEEVLEFAIKQEQVSASFYRAMARKMERPWMKAVFEEFAAEEDGHERKLKDIKGGKLPPLKQEKVQDLKIGDYLVEAELSPQMDYQQALVVAMKKEKAAFRLYSDLAQAAGDKKLKSLLLGLAQEEAKHKLRFEVEYDDQILKEN